MSRHKLILIVSGALACVLIGNKLTQFWPSTSVPTSQTSQNQVVAIASLPLPKITLPHITTPKPVIFANSYIVIDSDSNYPLLAKSPDTPLPIASTTKLMTAIVTLENTDLDKVVTISHHAATVEGSDIQLLTGETMTVRSLLYAMLLNSANDAANALAEANGSSDQFVALMNAKATAIGLQNTQYHDPAGLDDTGHSTPRDLAIIMKYGLSLPLFRTIVGTPSYTITSADGKYTHDLKNSDRLIHTDEPLYLPNAVGGKTGFTYAAGHCLVAAADYPNGKQYIAVVLNTVEPTKDASAKEARKLLTWAGQAE